MKYKTTQKEINKNYSTVIKAGFCRLQYLLKYENPQAYTSGKDGWKADIYDVNGVAIVTGYAPFGNVSPSYQTLEKYEKRACQIFCDLNVDYIEKEKKILDLLNQFIKEVTE